MNRVHDPFRLREERIFHLVRRRDPVLCANDDRRRIQIVKRKFRDVACKVAHEAVAFAGIARDDDAPGLLDALDDGFIVERNQRTRIDDLRRNAVFLLQHVRGLGDAIERSSNRENGHVLAHALDIGFAKRDFVFRFRHAFRVEELRNVIDALALEENDRIGAVERGLHKPLCVIRRSREYDLESGNVRHQRAPVLRVLRAVFAADAHAEHDRHLEHACAHGLPFAELVEDFVSRAA